MRSELHNHQNTQREPDGKMPHDLPLLNLSSLSASSWPQHLRRVGLRSVASVLDFARLLHLASRTPSLGVRSRDRQDFSVGATSCRGRSKARICDVVTFHGVLEVDQFVSFYCFL